MKFNPAQYAQALYEATSETSPKDYEVILDRFVRLLADNGDLGKFSEIEAEFIKLEGKKKGVSQTDVKVAIQHNAKLISELNKIVGNKAEYKTEIDEGLIGGVVIKVDEQLIDASIKTQLENLNKQLKS